jgi:hypothetical protein
VPVTHAAGLPREHPPRRGAPSEGGTEGPCAWLPVAPRGGTRNAGMPELRCGGSARGYQSDLRNVCGPAATRGQFNMQTRSEYLCIASFTEDARFCRRQGLPGLLWCAGVPVRRACRAGTVLLAVELIEGHGAGGEREPGQGARMPSGLRTGLRDGRAAGRVPAVPGRSGAGRRTPARNHRAGRGSGRRPDARERRGGAGRCGPGSPGYRRVRLPGASRPVVPSR